MLLHFITVPFITYFVPRLLDELQHTHGLKPQMASSLVQNQITVRAYWKNQNTTTWKSNHSIGSNYAKIAANDIIFYSHIMYSSRWL